MTSTPETYTRIQKNTYLTKLSERFPTHACFLSFFFFFFLIKAADQLYITNAWVSTLMQHAVRSQHCKLRYSVM